MMNDYDAKGYHLKYNLYQLCSKRTLGHNSHRSIQDLTYEREVIVSNLLSSFLKLP